MTLHAQDQMRVRLPLVSVLIPAFNHACFIGRCLDSVLEDPYPEKEIVIIDDGSVDGTGEVIAQWILVHGSRIPVHFVRRPNRGVAATLNELALRAHGQFLRVVASDDYLIPGGLEVQVKFLLKNTEKSAVIGDACVVDQCGRLLHASAMSDLHGARKSEYLSDLGIRRVIISRWAISGAVIMLRANAFDARTAWDERLKIEDWDFFLRLVARDGLGFVDSTVCAYRLHGSNASKTRDVQRRLANLREFRDVAMRHRPLFDVPESILLHAEADYIAAKIAFLQRRPLHVGYWLVRYGWKCCLAAVARPALRPRGVLGG
ncbi:glycosyltransferase [Xanthomonas campestris pv. badrii]|uniref:Glycosyltransferase n=1 Tax=Xanthomonas campestris pv. badrii TaxID=149696 RepID=A0A7Z2V9H9_XANCA|nr:glycosyltransferase [Xanthomonas campestris]QJD67449.1 glycosyltransferase [Xanthomonas campestris pv. badrii]